jgi:hypothetical protein
LAVLPWRLIVLGTEGTVNYDATFTPIFLVLVPLLLVTRRRAPAVPELLLSTGVGYLSWLASGLIATGSLFLNGRWLLPIFVPLSLLSALALEGMRIWDLENFSLRRVLLMLTGLTLALGLVAQVLLTLKLNPLAYLVGQQSRKDYQDQYTTQRYHQAITYLNQNLSPDEKVIFFWEPRSYGCRVSHQADPLLDNLSQYVARHHTAEAIIAALRAEGFTHVLVNDYVFPWIVRDFPITTDEVEVWEQLRAEFLNDQSLVHVEEEYQKIYRLPFLEWP